MLLSILYLAVHKKEYTTFGLIKQFFDHNNTDKLVDCHLWPQVVKYATENYRNGYALIYLIWTISFTNDEIRSSNYFK